MGFYRTTSIDYFVIVKPVEITVKNNRSKCSGCDKTSWDKFCSACGSKIVLVEKINKITTDHLDFIINEDEKLHDEYNGYFFTPEFCPLGFSAINFGTINKNYHDEDEKYFALTSDDLKPVEMLPEAKQKLDKFLVDYRSIYGEDSIELKYGVYSYDS